MPAKKVREEPSKKEEEFPKTPQEVTAWSRGYVNRATVSPGEVIPPSVTEMLFERISEAEIQEAAEVSVNAAKSFFESMGVTVKGVEKPEVFQEDLPDYAIFATGDGGAVGGVCYLGDGIGIDSKFKGKRVQRNPAQTRAIVQHETMHYFSNKGRGVGYEYFGWLPGLGYSGMGITEWFDEGMTEFFAQRICRSEGVGIPASDVSYASEVTFANRMIGIMGEEGEAVLAKAYYTGDFSEVERMVDAKLGKGSFEELMECENGREANKLLERKCGEKGIGASEFDSRYSWIESQGLILSPELLSNLDEVSSLGSMISSLKSLEETESVEEKLSRIRRELGELGAGKTFELKKAAEILLNKVNELEGRKEQVILN